MMTEAEFRQFEACQKLLSSAERVLAETEGWLAVATARAEQAEARAAAIVAALIEILAK